MICLAKALTVCNVFLFVELLNEILSIGTPHLMPMIRSNDQVFKRICHYASFVLEIKKDKVIFPSHVSGLFSVLQSQQYIPPMYISHYFIC